MALGDSRMRIFSRGTQVAAGRERQPGGNPSPSARMHCDRSCRLNYSGESLVRVFLRATKVAEGHARESGVNPRPREPSPPQRLVGSPQAVSKLHGARRSAVASIKAEADRRAANVPPIIREAQKAGATTLRQIAEALNARGVATACGGTVVRDVSEQRASQSLRGLQTCRSQWGHWSGITIAALA